MFTLIGIVIVVLIIGILFGYYYTKKNLKCDQAEILDQYMIHRETMKAVRSVPKSEEHPGKNNLSHKNPAKPAENPDTDHDVGVLNHHLGARGHDPAGSNFAHWKNDIESQDKIYWK